MNDDNEALQAALRELRQQTHELADLRAQAWVRLGARLGILKPPATAPDPAPPGLDDRWELLVGPGSQARLLPGSGESETLRVAIGRARGEAVWDIQLNQPGLSLVATRPYAVHFSARADGPRSICMGIAQAHAPWTGLGLYRNLNLTSQWQRFREGFVATADDDNARIHFDLGGSPIGVELAEVSLRDLPDYFVAEIAPAAPEPPPVVAEEVPVAPVDPAGRLHRPPPASRPFALRLVPRTALTRELLARIRKGAFSESEEAILLGCELRDALQAALEVHNNRWSARRYRDLFHDCYGSLGPVRPELRGATIVDLGCGSLNPYGMLFLFLLLGARRGIALDLDPIQNVPQALRALADLAAMLLITPRDVVGDFPIAPEQLLSNIASFDLAKLRAGDRAGIDPERLTYRHESVYALTLGDGEVDFVVSNAFFEHIPRVDEAIAQLARITRRGGIGVHIIDGSDHRRYGNPEIHPLEFLTEPDAATLVHGSNRIRPLQFAPLFERHGFEFVSFVPFDHAPLSPRLRDRLREPFRSLPDEVLNASIGKLVVRKQ